MMQRKPYAGVYFIPHSVTMNLATEWKEECRLKSPIQPAGTAKYFQFPPQTGLFILPSDRPKSFRASALVTLRISALLHKNNLFIAFFV